MEIYADTMIHTRNKNISRSRTALENEDFKTAINYCNAELKSNKKNVEVYLLRGTAYNQLGQTDKAIDDFKIALQLDPSNLEILKKLFFSYTKTGNIQKSIIACNEIIQRYPSDNDELVFKEICKLLMEKGKYQECLKLLNNIIKRSGEHHIYHHLIGLNHYKLYNYKDAIRHFKKAYKLDKNFKYLISLSKAYVQFNEGDKAYDELLSFWKSRKTELIQSEKIEIVEAIADISVKNGAIDDAINWYNELLIIFDDNSSKKEVELKKAHLYKMIMEYDKALEIYQTLIKVNSNSIQEFIYSADIYERKGMFKEAYEEYKKALYLDPYHKEANIGLANISIMKHDYHKAQELIDTLYEYNKLDANYIKGSITVFQLLYESDKDNKEEHKNKLYNLITDIIKLEPNQLSHYEKMINLLLIDDKLDYAVKILDSASNLITDNRIFLLKGYVNSYINFEDSYEFYNIYIDNDGSEEELQLFQAKYLYFNKDYESSLDILLKILHKNNNHIDALELLLENNIKLKDFEEASDILEQLIDIDETNYQYYYKKGIILARSKKYEESIEYFQRAIALNNYYIDSYYNLGLVYAKIKESEEAIKYFKVVLYLNINYDTKVFKKISDLL